tara:strand:+ start:2513 stop:3703 length:1191 start_codon:yes stop_codon:yes gene_type:complete
MSIQTTNVNTSETTGYNSGEEKHGDEFGECAVCYDELTDKTTVATPCGHLFCTKCFFKWLRESTTCPMCRKNYVEYTEWDYTRPYGTELSTEFNLFRDVIARTSDALTIRYEKKKRLDDSINVSNIYIEQKRTSCNRMEKDLEYKRGFYSAAHFPFTDLELYNACNDDEETAAWQCGFKNGLKEKYGCDLFERCENIIDPSIKNARRILHRLAMVTRGGISSATYDDVKNSMDKMLDKLAKKISKNEFMSIFKDGTITQKDGTELQVGITFKQFMEHEKITLDRTMYVDFMLDNKTNTWYKLPYYLNDDKQICYLDFEIKMKFIKAKLNIPIYYSKTNFEEEEEEYTYEERNARRTLFKEGVNDHKVEEGEIIRLSNEERVWTAPFANVVSDDLLW